MEARMKGNFFNKALTYARKKVGTKGLETIRLNRSEYLDEVFYPFLEFMQLLQQLEELFKDRNEDTLFQLGQFLIASDHRWPDMFKGMDPSEVFSCNTRQDGQMQIGDFGMHNADPNQVNLTLSLWSNDPEHLRLFTTYYSGAMKGVLDLTGRKGDVKMVLDPSEIKSDCLMVVTWE